MTGSGSTSAVSSRAATTQSRPFSGIQSVPEAFVHSSWAKAGFEIAKASAEQLFRVVSRQAVLAVADSLRSIRSEA